MASTRRKFVKFAEKLQTAQTAETFANRVSTLLAENLLRLVISTCSGNQYLIACVLQLKTILAAIKLNATTGMTRNAERLLQPTELH